MNLSTIPPEVLAAYGITSLSRDPVTLTSGHINTTLRIDTKDGSYILQKINDAVFQNPDAIARNTARAQTHLSTHYPDYLFPEIVPTSLGALLARDKSGHPWRLTKALHNVVTVNAVDTPDRAYEAARAFGTLAQHLAGVEQTSFEIIIPRFHDLTLRLEQFDTAYAHAHEERKHEASEEITKYQQAREAVQTTYRDALHTGMLKQRIFHHDTKINNVLFDTTTKKAVCVIDLDTLMPGYVTSDIGDMIRTFVSVYENETDLSKVTVRTDIYDALVRGYLDAYGSEMSSHERALIPFAGRFMTYQLGLRMLTDYFNNDAYFRVEYPTQNLDRARNQIRLFEELSAYEPKMI